MCATRWECEFLHVWRCDKSGWDFLFRLSAFDRARQPRPKPSACLRMCHLQSLRIAALLSIFASAVQGQVRDGCVKTSAHGCCCRGICGVRLHDVHHALCLSNHHPGSISSMNCMHLEFLQSTKCALLWNCSINLTIASRIS